MSIIWVKFAVSALVIVIAGVRITGFARVIAEKTGLGFLWGGFILLPLATSLPELVTSWRAASIDAPDLAAGNLFGSMLFNLAVIAVIDAAQGRGALFYRLNKSHIFTASFAVIIAAFTGAALLIPHDLTVLWIGIDTVIIIVLYGIAVFMVSKKEKREHPKETAEDIPGIEETSLFKAIFSFLLLAALIVAAGVNLTDAADSIAIKTGLGQTFIGTLLLAASTSLPEMVTTFTAVRMGLLDMAVANIFGANLMNLALLFFTDIFYTGGPVLSSISRDHLMTIIFVIIITAVAIASLIYGTKRQFANIGLDSLLIFILYIVSFIFLYYANLSI